VGTWSAAPVGCFLLVRADAAKMAMAARRIVEPADVIGHIQRRCVPIGVNTLLDAFLLQAAEEGLGNRAVPALARLSCWVQGDCPCKIVAKRHSHTVSLDPSGSRPCEDADCARPSSSPPVARSSEVGGARSGERRSPRVFVRPLCSHPEFFISIDWADEYRTDAPVGGHMWANGFQKRRLDRAAPTFRSPPLGLRPPPARERGPSSRAGIIRRVRLINCGPRQRCYTASTL
jgi:hypothetical protein